MTEKKNLLKKYFFLFTAAVVFVSGCGEETLYQLSSTVPQPVPLVNNADKLISFTAVDIDKSDNFVYKSRSFDGRKTSSRQLITTWQGGGASETVILPFHTLFPRLDLNTQAVKYLSDLNGANADVKLPVMTKVRLESIVKHDNVYEPDENIYKWNVQVYLEDVNKEKIFIGSEKFSISSRKSLKMLQAMPPATFNGKVLHKVRKNTFKTRDHQKYSDMNAQDIYDEILSHSIFSSAVNVLNRSPDKVRHYARQRNEAINADRIERHWALVIGVSRYLYPRSGLSPLAFADKDAVAVADSFYNHLNWPRSRIRLLINESVRSNLVMAELQKIIKRMGERDMLTIYWSGHGFERNGDTFLACYDTMTDKTETAISMTKLRTFLEQNKVKNLLFIADTCHAGSIVTGSRGLNVVAYQNTIAPIKRPSGGSGWIYMLAAEADRQAVEDKQWGHGAFTCFLLKGLAGEADGYEGSGKCDKIITPAELRAYLRTKVPFETQKALGTAIHPLIQTNNADSRIWDINIYEKE